MDRESYGRVPPQNMATEIWAAMGEIYGTAWKEKFGALPGPGWVQLCGELSPKLIRRGLRNIRDDGSRFLPNMGQFRQACFRQDAQAEPGRQQDSIPELPKMSKFQIMANREFLNLVKERCGLPESSVPPLVNMSKHLVRDFDEMRREGDDCSHFGEMWRKQAMKIVTHHEQKEGE